MDSCRSDEIVEIRKYLLCLDGGQYALFYGIDPFNTLFGNEGLIEGDILRRQHVRGGADDFYSVTGDGKLRGLTDIPQYPGLDGVFEPADMLSEEVNPDGWILSPVLVSTMISRIDI